MNLSIIHFDHVQVVYCAAGKTPRLDAMRHCAGCQWLVRMNVVWHWPGSVVARRWGNTARSTLHMIKMYDGKIHSVSAILSKASSSGW